MPIPTFRPATFALAVAILALAALAPLSVRAEDGGITQVDQVGSGNRTDIEQKFVASGGSLNAQNRATVLQDGTSLTGTIGQTGAGNVADILQQGDTLTATIGQTGAGNAAAIEQYGSGHQAEVLQNGGDHVTIVQSNIYTDHGAPTGGPGQAIVVDQTH